VRLHHLRPPAGAKKRPIRVGRGESGRRGKTAGRGMKGQKARGQSKVGFEGGQTPLKLRLPKLRGFKNPFRKEFAVVNIGRLSEAFGAGDIVDVEALRSKGLITKKKLPVKLLGDGDIDKPLSVRVDACSSSAREKIEAAGGSVETTG
jgi:large subunit ribosomal protein L15